MSERKAKERRAGAWAQGEVPLVRARVTRGEVQKMLDDQKAEIIASLESYREHAILPVLQLATKRAAAYIPFWRAALNWIFMKWHSRKSVGRPREA